MNKISLALTDFKLKKREKEINAEINYNHECLNIEKCACALNVPASLGL